MGEGVTECERDWPKEDEGMDPKEHAEGLSDAFLAINQLTVIHPLCFFSPITGSFIRSFIHSFKALPRAEGFVSLKRGDRNAVIACDLEAFGLRFTLPLFLDKGLVGSNSTDPRVDSLFFSSVPLLLLLLFFFFSLLA